MLAAKGDLDPYEPVCTTSVVLDSCHKCYGLRLFCLDPGIYFCKNCKHTWQRRLESQYSNPKAYHHFQGYNDALPPFDI